MYVWHTLLCRIFIYFSLQAGCIFEHPSMEVHSYDCPEHNTFPCEVITSFLWIVFPEMICRVVISSKDCLYILTLIARGWRIICSVSIQWTEIKAGLCPLMQGRFRSLSSRQSNHNTGHHRIYIKQLQSGWTITYGVKIAVSCHSTPPSRNCYTQITGQNKTVPVHKTAIAQFSKAT